MPVAAVLLDGTYRHYGGITNVPGIRFASNSPTTGRGTIVSLGQCEKTGRPGFLLVRAVREYRGPAEETGACPVTTDLITTM